MWPKETKISVWPLWKKNKTKKRKMEPTELRFLYTEEKHVPCFGRFTLAVTYTTSQKQSMHASGGGECSFIHNLWQYGAAMPIPIYQALPCS